jgi:tricorn protease
VSANGNRIVFEKDYQLWVYNVSSGTSSKVNGQVVRHSALERDQDFRVQSNISNFDVAGDKKKLAFVSRGELFISDIDGKFVQQIETASDGRVMEVKWLADNKTILFSQTWNGYQNWFTIAADGSTPETRRTSDMQNNRGIALNSDRSKAVYLSGRGDVRIMDLSAFSSETVAEEEIWDISYSSPSFSPDDRYVVFTAIRNFEQNIYVYDTQENRQITITDTGVSEANPVWSPDGKYIYFQTNRTMPSYPYGMRDAGIWRIALDRVDPEFRSDQVRALFEENDEEESDVKVTIREEGLRDRWESVGASFGSQSSPFVVQRNGKTIVLYRSNHDQGRNSWWKTVYEPFKSPVTEMINGTRMGGNTLVEVNGSLYALMSGDIYTMNPDAGSVSKIDISHTFRRNLRAEFDQMFDEMWANLEVNFYSDDFHGVEWAEIREQYRAYLPYVRSRDNLRVMMNDMLGELNTSHIGFSSGGDEESTYYGSTTLSGGILFSKDNPWTVDRLVANSTAHRSGADIRSGDRLTAVNGVQVDTDQNREMYFSRPSMDQEMVLTFSRGRDQFDVKLRPESYFATRNNLYDEWMYDRKRRVDESSGNRIAYVHMKNMGGGELQHFLQEMVAFGNSKDGLILDLRYNTGGNVHDAVLQFLSQRLYLNWSYRGGALSTQPNFTPSSNPIVLLINEPSLSDAEMLAGGFRELGLGTIIGTETYRWIIFTSGKGLVDGSSYRLPSWGVYSLTGENLEKTGVSPDIVVEKTFKDRLDGRDPQLERAVQHILQQLKN